MRILVAEPLDPIGVETLETYAEVDIRNGLNREELLSVIGDYDGLVVRSRTKVDAVLLSAADRLRVVGRAGTGVDNIDLDAATRSGVAIVNAPTGNSNAVAEHTITLMLALSRQVCKASSSMKAGRWEKSALMGTEIKGKTLGLIGLGRIARLVASKVRGLGMRVLAFDPYVGAESASSAGVSVASLEDLLKEADYVSVHTPLTADTRHMIGERELALMKPTSFLLNCARGGVVDEQALGHALESGVIAGAALDVYEEEPAIANPLVNLENVIATPHVAGSTFEAQRNVAIDVAEAVLDVLRGRLPKSPVNVPYLAPEAARHLRPYIDLAERMGSFFVQWRGELGDRLELVYSGGLTSYDTRLLTSSFLAGLLKPVCGDEVNVVNASLVAAERGLVVSEARRDSSAPFDSLIAARVPQSQSEASVSGTVIYGQPHLVGLDGFRLDCVAQGYMLVDLHQDRPGIVGSMGSILGEARINISFVQMSRVSRGGGQVMMLGLDDRVPADLIPRFLDIPGVERVRAVALPPFEGHVNGEHD